MNAEFVVSKSMDDQVGLEHCTVVFYQLNSDIEVRVSYVEDPENLFTAEELISQLFNNGFRYRIYASNETNIHLVRCKTREEYTDSILRLRRRLNSMCPASDFVC